MAANLPKTVMGFLKHINSERHLWESSTEDYRDDGTDSTGERYVFWLASDSGRKAYLAHEYGRFIVTLQMPNTYWFDLDRLHEFQKDSWSWVQQIKGKSWCEPEHIDFLEKLYALFPNK